MKPTDKRRVIAVECAVRRYAGSVRQGSVPCRADGNADGQAVNYREAAERTELRADQVRRVIMAHGVPLIQFMIYRNFGLHVDKLCRAHAGETLRERALDAILRWKCYGCKPEVLEEICAQVFGLGVFHSPDAQLDSAEPVGP